MDDHSERVYGTVKENQLGNWSVLSEKTGITKRTGTKICESISEHGTPARSLNDRVPEKNTSGRMWKSRETEPYIVGGHRRERYWGPYEQGKTTFTDL